MELAQDLPDERGDFSFFDEMGDLVREGAAQHGSNFNALIIDRGKELEVIDEVIEEPMGGAHRAKEETYHRVGLAIESALDELTRMPVAILRQRRAEKFLAMGQKGLS